MMRASLGVSVVPRFSVFFAVALATAIACVPTAPASVEATAPTATVAPTETPVPTATPPPTATPSPVPSPTPTAAPTPTPVPAQPQIQTPGGDERQFIRQGEALLIWLPADAPDAPAVTYQGQRVSLVPAGNRWLGVLGVPPWAAPGPASVAIAYPSRRVELSLSVRGVDFPVQRITLPPSVAPLSVPAVLNDEQGFLDSFFAVRTPMRLWRGPFLQPVVAEPPTAFGLQRIFNGQPTGNHLGVDYSADEGAPVAAANAGRAALARRLDVRGNAVILDHGGGLFSGYYHLSQMAVTEGETVAKGQRLGLVGSTGLATGPHLHWEMRVGSNPVDPLPWLGAER